MEQSYFENVIRDFKSDPVKFLRENLSLLITLPAVLGGLWQILELANLSFSFIRFFSLSQIIPDGLLILFLLILSFTVFYLIKLLLQSKTEESASENPEEERVRNELVAKWNRNLIRPHRTYSILNFLLFLIGICTVTYVIYNFPNFSNLGDLIFFIVGIGIGFLILMFLFFNAIRFSTDINETNLNDFGALVLIPFLFYLYVLCKGFHSICTLPNSLVNIENIYCNLNESSKESKIEITYVNDKYVFLSVTPFRKYEFIKDTVFLGSRIKIISFETMLDEDCIKQNRIEKNKAKDSLINVRQQLERAAQKSIDANKSFK